MAVMVRVFVASTLLTSYAVAARIATEQTRIEVRAGASGPMLVSLGSGAGQWVNSASEKLIDSVWMNGVPRPVKWKWNRRASAANAQGVSFVYESDAPKLRAIWEWKARAAFGPIEHAVHIQNLEPDEIWIPLQDSLGFALRVQPEIALEQFSVEKGADKPSAIGTRRAALDAGSQWTGTSSTYAHPAEGEPREIIPWFAVERPGAHDGFYHDGFYVGIEFSGRTRLTLDRDRTALRGVAGLNREPGPFRTRLKPRETFDTPTVFVGAFRGNMDAMGNVLRPWVRQVLTNARAWANPQYPLLVNNTWGTGMQVDEALAQKMVRDSAELGLEMLHVDAGWFRAVGDWYPDPKKFPHGLAALADDAHRHGLKFGVWSDWTQAGLSDSPGALNVHDPKVRGWMVSDLPEGWKPEPFKGQTIDLGVAAAQDYARDEVDRLVTDYHLDMLEHDGYLVAQGCVREDHPHAPPDPRRTQVVKNFVESSNSTDVSYHATRAYYAVHEGLRKKHPELLLEICNDGGRMVDFGSAAHGDYFSITDTYDPVSNRRAFFDASYLLPAAMLEAYVEKWPTPRIENFRYMLRSGMMGWLTVMLDTNAWTPEQHAAAKEEIAIYKLELRNLIRDADLYHVSSRPDGVHWDGIEYFDPTRQRGVVYAFRGSIENEKHHSFRLAGLTRAKQYRLRFHDHSAQDRVATGEELLDAGLDLSLAVPNSSELVFIGEAN